MLYLLMLRLLSILFFLLCAFESYAMGSNLNWDHAVNEAVASYGPQPPPPPPPPPAPPRPPTATSRHLGPQLREGDKPIPEGIYHITYLNPFSNMHLSMKINYPNAFDRQHASAERRRRLGSNIFIHGKTYSVGCLAIGDKAIDELFLLTHRVGLEHVQLIIAPNDLRRAKPIKSAINQPRWVPTLYQNIRVALNQFPLEHNPHLQASLH